MNQLESKQIANKWNHQWELIWTIAKEGGKIFEARSKFGRGIFLTVGNGNPSFVVLVKKSSQLTLNQAGKSLNGTMPTRHHRRASSLGTRKQRSKGFFVWIPISFCALHPNVEIFTFCSRHVRVPPLEVSGLECQYVFVIVNLAWMQ